MRVHLVGSYPYWYTYIYIYGRRIRFSVIRTLSLHHWLRAKHTLRSLTCKSLNCFVTRLYSSVSSWLCVLYLMAMGRFDQRNLKVWKSKKMESKKGAMCKWYSPKFFASCFWWSKWEYCSYDLHNIFYSKYCCGAFPNHCWQNNQQHLIPYIELRWEWTLHYLWMIILWRPVSFCSVFDMSKFWMFSSNPSLTRIV